MKKYLKRWLFPHEDGLEAARASVHDELNTRANEAEIRAQDLRNINLDLRNTIWKVQDDLTRAQSLNGHQAKIIELQARQIDVLNSLVAFYEQVGAKQDSSQ